MRLAVISPGSAAGCVWGIIILGSIPKPASAKARRHSGSLAGSSKNTPGAGEAVKKILQARRMFD